MVNAQGVYTVGRLFTREFRRAILREGLKYQEDRGWLDSQFIVSGPLDKMGRFHRLAEAWAERINAD